MSGGRSLRSRSADDLAVAERRVAGHLAALAQVGQELVAAPVPGPFLELEAQAVDLLVEEPLRVDVAAQQPAALGAEVEAGQRPADRGCRGATPPAVSQAKFSGCRTSRPSQPISLSRSATSVCLASTSARRSEGVVRLTSGDDARLSSGSGRRCGPAMRWHAHRDSSQRLHRHGGGNSPWA